MYRLYWSSLSPWTEGYSGQDPPGCVEPSSGVSLLNNSNCLFSSVCGMKRAAEGMSDWETLSDSVAYSFEVLYIVAVAVVTAERGVGGRAGGRADTRSH